MRNGGLFYRLFDIEKSWVETRGDQSFARGIDPRENAQNADMKQRVRVYDPEGVRTREERESFVKKFSPEEAKNAEGIHGIR